MCGPPNRPASRGYRCKPRASLENSRKSYQHGRLRARSRGSPVCQVVPGGPSAASVVGLQSWERSLSGSSRLRLREVLPHGRKPTVKQRGATEGAKGTTGPGGRNDRFPPTAVSSHHRKRIGHRGRSARRGSSAESRVDNFSASATPMARFPAPALTRRSVKITASLQLQWSQWS